MAERFLVCDLGVTRLGFPVDSVTEVLGPRPLARVPWGPPWLAGVINHRARVHSVVDLGRFAEIPEAAAPSVFVLVDRPELNLAFGVAGVQVVERRTTVQVTELRYYVPEAAWILEALSTPEFEFHVLDLEGVVDAVVERF